MAIKELFQDSRPQVLFDPRASQRIDPRFKFTRDGAASYYDSDGVLRYAPANQPRVGIYEVDGNAVMQPVGLLLEGSGTNTLLYSSDFSSIWNSSYGTLTLNVTTSPDGTSNAALFQADGVSTAFLFSGLYQTFSSINSGTTITFSIFVKNSTANTVRLAGGSLNNRNYSATFDFSTSSFTGQSASVFSTKVEQFSNGWLRLSFTTNYADFSTARFTILPDSTNSVYLYGAQIETGISYPTSYIPTAGSAVTRAADLLSIEGTTLPSTGSIYIDARSLISDVDDTLLSAANASDDKLTLAIRQPASLYNSKALVYEVDGAFKPTLPFPVPSNVRERNLITYGANNYHYRSDSSRLTPSSSSSVPAGMNRLGIGHDITDPTKAITGYINTVYLWPGEITPTVAEALVRGDLDPKDADAGVFTPEAGALAFVFNTQGTATDGDRVVQLPFLGSTNNVLVDWGDNTSSSFIGAAASSTVSHTYPSAGIYPVQITADDDGTNSGLQNLEFYNNSPLDLVRVLQWGGSTTFNPTTMFRIFRDCTQLDFENAARTNLPDTSAITNWQEAFFNCSSISGTFPTFDTSAATSFGSTWFGCSSLTAFPFITSNNVTSFLGAWYDCSGLTSFPLINTSASTSFSNAWYNCSGLTSFPLIATSSCLSFSGTWQSCSGLTSFPAIDTSAGTIFSNAWRSCSSLTSFPLINTGAGTSFLAAWYGCSGLTSFPLLNTSNATSMQEAWRNCTSLTSFPLLDTSNCQNFQRAWFNCSSLTSFPALDFSGNTLNNSFFQTWYNCSSLTSFPVISTANVTTFNGAWNRCSSLTSFPALDASAVTDFREAWRVCSGLTSFPTIDTSSGENFYETWLGCAGLTAFPALDTSSGQNFFRAWQGCTGLTAFPSLDFSSAVGAPNNQDGLRDAWSGCSSLTSFPANMFDSTASTNFLNAFTSCALTATSIENILVSINTANTSNGTLSLGGGTNADTSTWTTAANNAYIALIGRGWTITQNGTAPS